MDVTSTQRVVAIGLVVFVASAAFSPAVAAAKAPLATVLFQPSIPSPTFRSSLPESPKRPKPPKYRAKPILRYDTTVQVGDASVILGFKARLKRRSAVKFELRF